ncbi:MAG: flagellar biosynthetic protein FliR [Pseudomonadota bacterium]
MAIDIETFSYIQNNVQSVIIATTFAMMRPLGFTLTFICFIWAFPQANVARTGITFGLAIPIVVHEYQNILSFFMTYQFFWVATFFIKELIIGLIIGTLLSIPFWIVQFSGGLIDAYRGESNAGAQDPVGGELPTVAHVQVVVAFLIFFAGGGAWFLMEMLYRSFEVWPMTSSLPALSGDATKAILGLFDYITITALVIAAPILFVLMTIDFVLVFTAKIAKGFSPMDISFTIKNLMTLLALPIMAMIFVQYIDQNLFKNMEIFSIVKSIFQ